MVTRAVAVCVGLLFASIARAGAVIELVPDNPGPYAGGEAVTVDYMISQSCCGAQHYLRFVQFDMNESDPELELTSFDFTYERWCPYLPPDACFNYRPFEDLHDGDGAVVSTVFYGLGTDTMSQINLPAFGQIKVGELEITLPTAPGPYTLDALNPGAEDVVNGGAQISFGFGGNDPVTYWRATQGNVTGGQYVFEVVPEPATLVMLALGGWMILCHRMTYDRGSGS